MRFADETKVKERVEKPLNKAEVSKGQSYESGLRLFTELKNEEDATKEEAYKSFLEFTTVSLTEQAHERVREFIQFPLSSVSISRGIISDLYKVFNAGNSFFNVQTVKNNGGEKLQELLKRLKVNDWIEEKAKKALKNAPNTIVVVDRGEKGEPYLIAVDNNRLVDFEYKENGRDFEYITFIHSKTTDDKGKEVVKYSLYDEEKYYVIVKTADGKFSVDKGVKHGLNYCPARNILGECLNSDSKLSRYTPMALGLTKLKEWQYFDTYKFYTDHYIPFPVTEMVRKECGDANCKDGVITQERKYEVEGEMEVKTSTKVCKTCIELNSIGVGAKILIDKQTEKDEATASGKFRVISAETDNLEYLNKKLKEIEESIRLKVVGADDILKRQSVNKDQVRGSFESKTNVLLSVKNDLDSLYVWIVETVAGLYIPNKPIVVNANYGTEWYLVGEDELQKRYETAKNSGIPREEVASIYNQLIETKYKGNPNKLNRSKLINELTPCPFDSLDDLIKKKNAGAVTESDFIITCNILEFVNRFESEEGNILEFGSADAYKIQVSKIKEIINTYANEYKEENKA